MISIRTKYMGPTNYRSCRIKAEDGRGNTVTMSRDYENEIEDDHKLAALSLCAEMGWPLEIKGGSYKGDYYWIFV